MPKKSDKWKLSRRDFLKLTGAAGASGALLDWVATGPNPAMAATVVKTVRNICPYCSVGCAIKIGVDASDNIVDIYGDSNSVINRGSLCSKGSALLQLANGSQRIGITGQTDHYLYGSGAVMTGGPMKRTGNGAWESVSWADAFTQIAGYMKQVKDLGSADHVAFLGSSHMTQEECYMYKKLITLFGTNNTEHQARI
jgi:formate dehydrogenase major subunit